jgi:cell division septum initiation protein DivIVA
LDLQKENDALKQRIKRLEKAGDAILNAENDDEEYKAIIQWNKAKEAKP